MSDPCLGTVVNGAHLSLLLLVLGLLAGPFQLFVSPRELLAQQALLCFLQRHRLDMRRQRACERAEELGSSAELLGLRLRHNRMPMLSFLPGFPAFVCIPCHWAGGGPELRPLLATYSCILLSPFGVQQSYMPLPLFHGQRSGSHWTDCCFMIPYCPGYRFLQ